MERLATDPACIDSLHSIEACVAENLEIISDAAKSYRMQIFRKIVLQEGDAPVLVEQRPLRLGIYPLAADPMHWGHILVGLSAVASLKLDKVVYIIAGTDVRKPSMSSADSRHRLGRAVIEVFHPLFEYSSLALHSALDGEANCGRLLKLNARQPMVAFYIAGRDHYRRTTLSGEDDTIAKLERVSVANQENSHRRQTLSAAFVAREGILDEERDVHTFLNVRTLPAVPFSFSSTAARKALCKDSDCVALVAVPYPCLLEMRSNGLYTHRGECIEE